MTTTPTTPEQAAASHAEAPDYGVLRWLVLATFVVILNETVMINAIPRLMEEFAVTTRAAQWLTSGFMLTMAVVIPVTGWFLQRVTTRQAFTTAMTIFCTGTLVAALAPTFSVLLLARVIQAGGTAIMMPLLMTTLMSIVREQDRGRIMGNVTLAISVAPALGPAVSGTVLALGSWRLLFVVVLPIALTITWVGLRNLENVGETRVGSIDWASVALSAFGFGPLVFGLSQLGEGSSTGPSWLPVAMLGLGAAMLTVFVLRQVRLQRGGVPLLDLRTLTHRTYALALSLMAVSFMAMLGSLILLPLYLQGVRGLSELQTGLLVMPGGIAMGLLGPQVGKVFDRVGGRPLVIPGSLGVFGGLALLTQVGATTPVAFVLGAHVLLMVSLAAIFTPVFTLGLGSLPPELYSHGSSLLATLQQVAAAAGTAVVVAVVASRQAGLLDGGASELAARVGGNQWALGVGAVLALVVVALALVLPGRASTHGADTPEKAGAAH